MDATARHKIRWGPLVCASLVVTGLLALVASWGAVSWTVALVCPLWFIPVMRSSASLAVTADEVGASNRGATWEDVAIVQRRFGERLELGRGMFRSRLRLRNYTSDFDRSELAADLRRHVPPGTTPSLVELRARLGVDRGRDDVPDGYVPYMHVSS